MKKLMILPVALAMLTLSSGGSDAGLFDEIFSSKKTVKDPQTYGRIVWKGKNAKDRPIQLASQQELPPGVELAPGEYLVPSPEGDGHTPPPPPAGGLFPHVKYEDLDNVHPCAVKMVVQVKDPCPQPRDPCSRCKPEPRCVLVEICVPPCGCKKIKVSRDGDEVEYDFGDYEVEIKSKKGYIVVNYDD